MERLEATDTSIARAVAALRDGQVIAYPTETVYGLGNDPFNEEAMERLFAAKGRDRSNPALLIVASPEQLSGVVGQTNERAQRLMEAFWPGPVSILLPRHPALPESVTAGSDKVCVRCPGLPWARALCEAFGGPVTSTSANRSGEPPVQSLADLDLPGVALAFDAGVLGDTPPSTIVDGETGNILREGAVSGLQIAAVWNSGSHHL
jgi:L-threonylcarbamoyladenylate synthase